MAQRLVSAVGRRGRGGRVGIGLFTDGDSPAIARGILDTVCAYSINILEACSVLSADGRRLTRDQFLVAAIEPLADESRRS
jgi:hypothetical protein